MFNVRLWDGISADIMRLCRFPKYASARDERPKFARANRVARVIANISFLVLASANFGARAGNFSFPCFALDFTRSFYTYWPAPTRAHTRTRAKAHVRKRFRTLYRARPAATESCRKRTKTTSADCGLLKNRAGLSYPRHAVNLISIPLMKYLPK